MSKETRIEPIRPGQSFRDGEGHRWWVRGPRPGAEGQFVVEAEMKGPAGYPRVGLYVMTERELREKASGERPGR